MSASLSRARGSRLRRLLALTAVAAGSIALASPASAAEWGYEQISPSDGSSIDVYGRQVSQDLSTVHASTVGAPMGGMPSDGRAGYFYYGLPRNGAPWTVGPLDARNGLQLATSVRGISPDGSRMLLRAGLASLGSPSEAVYRVDAQGAAESMTLGQSIQTVKGDVNLDAMAFLTGTFPLSLYVGRPGQAPVLASVDNAGNPLTATALGGSTGSGAIHMFADRAMSADGSSVLFTTRDEIPGDNDSAHPESPVEPEGRRDVYRRVLTPGHEETYVVSDANGVGDDDPGFDADYRWATADHDRVFFVTAEALEPGDTDGEQDVYQRDGKEAPVRVSQGETVDGSPTGNGANLNLLGYVTDWVASSQDGNRTFFVTAERLTQDAPADGIKLYERDVAEGRTRFVAGPLTDQDVDNGNVAGPPTGPLLGTSLPDLSFRGIRVTPNGAVLSSSAPLAGSADDGARKLFVWTRGGSLEQIGKPDADVPSSPGGFATFLSYPTFGAGGAPELNPTVGGRGVSDDGSRVIFSTEQPLTAQDTDGRYRDVYVWSKADGVRLVSPPGRAPYNANYVDSSPDGSKVFFNTAESILPTDKDPNAVDVYLAILGGGSAPSPQVPDADPSVCGGDACQGPIAGLTLPSVGSVSFAGPGNLLAGPDPVTPSVVVSKVKVVTGPAATLRVRVPDGGRISVTGASLRSASVSASKAGTYSVKVALTARAKSTLKRKTSLKVSAQVSYRAGDGQVASTAVSVTFKQPKPKARTKKGGR